MHSRQLISYDGCQRTKLPTRQRGAAPYFERILPIGEDTSEGELVEVEHVCGHTLWVDHVLNALPSVHLVRYDIKDLWSEVFMVGKVHSWISHLFIVWYVQYREDKTRLDSRFDVSECFLHKVGL